MFRRYWLVCLLLTLAFLEANGASNKKGSCPAMEHASVKQLDFYARELLADGMPYDALACWQRSLKVDSKHVETYFSVGDVKRKLGDFKGFVDNYKKGIKTDPNHPGVPLAYHNLATVYFQQKDFENAEKYYRKALKKTPKNHQVMFALAQIEDLRGNLPVAMSYLESAIEIYGENANYYNNLGNVYNKLGRTVDAIRSYRESIDVNPDCADCHFNLASLYFNERRNDDALKHAEKGIELEPASANGHALLATILADALDFTPALRHFQRADELSQEHGGLPPTTGTSFALTKARVCDWSGKYTIDTLTDTVRGSLERKTLPAIHAFSALTLPLTAHELLQFAQLNGELALAHSKSDYGMSPRTYSSKDLAGYLEAPPTKKNKAPKQLENEKIRIGYVSHNFGAHPTTELVLTAIRGHDRDKFYVICYSGVVSKEDGAAGKEIKDACDEFIELPSFKSLQHQVEMISQHRLAIFVNLDGMPRGHTSSLFTLKLAPIQLNFLGFPGSVGKAFSSSILADGVMIPPELSGDFEEKVVLMPHTYQPNVYSKNYPVEIESVGVTRKDRDDAGFPDPADTLFCCLNQLYKVDERIFEVWIRILKATPHSKLWLLRFPPEGEENLRRYLEQAGVEGDRLFFTDKEENKQLHLKRVGYCDVFLDTMGVGSHTTALDALWAGVPLVTYPQRKFAQRVAASLITTLGVAGTIASDEENYLELAIFLGNNNRVPDRIRKSIAKKRGRSPLFDSDRWASDFDRALRLMWEVRARDAGSDQGSVGGGAEDMWHIVVGQGPALGQATGIRDEL